MLSKTQSLAVRMRLKVLEDFHREADLGIKLNLPSNFMNDIFGKDSDVLNRQRLYIRNGFVSNELRNKFAERIYEISEAIDSNKSLEKAYTEPVTYEHLNLSNWFYLHPEKVCGEEYGGTGNAFPVLVKGTVQDIVSTIEKTVGPKKTFKVNPQVDNTSKLKLQLQAKAKAKAILIQMKMSEAI